MRVLVVLLVLALVACGAFFATTYKRWEGTPPEIRLDHDFKSLGRSPSLQLTINDAQTGLKHVGIRVRQKDQETVLADDSFGRSPAQQSQTYDIGKLLG